MAFSLFSKPTNKSKGSATPAKSPAVDVRPANDSKRPEPEPAKAGSPEGQNASRNNNSTLMLGVSRDYELEADQLGVQYAWNAGYDPGGFVRFFDKMATKKGYVNGVSWFRTHPPFYQRMVQSEREIMFLQPRPQAITQTSAFEQMKKDLAPVVAKAEKEEIGKPSLLITHEEGCEPPKMLEYRPDQPIEELCSSLPLITRSGKAQK